MKIFNALAQASKASAATPYSPGSAAQLGYVSCHACGKLHQVGVKKCTVCATTLRVRRENSLEITMALLITSMLFYIPANVYPMMINYQLGEEIPATIIEGVLLFIEQKSYFVAIVIFLASIVIPITKMVALSWLCFSVKYGKKMQHDELTLLYRITEFIGKWSMVDVFVVAIMAGLVQIGAFAAVIPGTAVISFGGVVILTMLAAHFFDPRLIWDKLESE